jgi:VCBS repeat-containing protein
METGLSDSMIIESSGGITDMNLLLYVNHSRVGDLWAALTHEETATDVEILDRPGVPVIGVLGCESDDINALFDDEAGTAAEDMCNGTPPAIAGSVLAIDLLSLFDGESINGTWTLTLADGAPGETGALLQWCLAPSIAGNTAPVADDQSVTTNEDTDKPITLTGSDIDLDSLTFDIVTSPGNGALTGSAPNVTYVPDENFFGADSFTFTANDGAEDSAIATIDITVNAINDPPVADDQSVGTDEDVAVPITLTGSDVEGDEITFLLVTPPAHGDLSGTAPDLVYTPDPMYFGMDSFTFRVNDGTEDSAIATVTIEIDSVNDQPTADDQSVDTDEDTPLDVALTGNDPDGDLLTYIIVDPPSHGSLDESLLPTVTYTPDADYHGPDSFTFKVNDSTVDSAIATVGITVNPVNDPPDAVTESISLLKGETTSELVGGATSLLSNDSDIEGDNLSVTSTPVSGPASGTLSLSTDGTFSYTHDDSLTATDSFVYEVCDDGVPSECDTALVNITIDVGVLPEVIHADGFETE